MEVDMETSPSYFDPEDLSTRERYRRYEKRHSTSSHDNSVSKFSGTRILYDGQSIERRPNAALFLKDIKQEVESIDADQLEGTPSKTQPALWRKSLAGNRGVSEVDVAADSIRRPGSYSLKSCKNEDDALLDGGHTTFTLFASLLDSALQGLMPIPDLTLQFERSCRNVSESISNILFREFALISMWRVPAMLIGAHTLLSFLLVPLKQPTETLLSTEDHDVSEDLREFQDWSRKENPWLVPAEDHVYESVEPLFLELHAIAMLCLPSGECMCPDATLCVTNINECPLFFSKRGSCLLLPAHGERLYLINRQLLHGGCLRCLATDGGGLGPHELNDGGILATVIAAGFKDWVKSNTRHPAGITRSCLTSYVLFYMVFRELVRFQAGVTMEISRLDAWYSIKDGSLEGPATYIVWVLCRRCCIPEVILRYMQVSVSLVESGNPPESHDELIELVASPETGFLRLFGQQQLQSDGCYMGDEFSLSLYSQQVWTFVIDGSWRAADQSPGVACVFNIDQSCVQDYASRMQLPSPLLAEVKACW
ncbi:unnamed protein product [Camellia sinensis]